MRGLRDWDCDIFQASIEKSNNISKVINSPRMLLNTHKKTSSTTFPQELQYVKHRKQSSSGTGNCKNSEYFKTMTAVLDLLLGAYPFITDELLTLKQALKKWYQHLQEESIAKNRQLMEMRDSLVVYVTKEIGVTLEEIGYYVKNFTQNYCDDDMRRLYAQYLQAIKKLEWQQNPAPSTIKHQAIQTEQQQLAHSSPPTAKSINTNPFRPSEATIDSPLRYKDIDIHKYIKTKQENLQLQRKISQMASRISDLQAQNKGLKREIEHLHDENMQCRASRERELKEVNKLKHLLSDLKSEEEARHEREEARKSNFSNAEKRFEDCESIKNALHQSLQSAEMHLFNKQDGKDQLGQQEYFIKNYHSAVNPAEDRYQTIKKQGRAGEYRSDDSELRMLLIQAITIESYINNQIDDDQ